MTGCTAAAHCCRRCITAGLAWLFGVLSAATSAATEAGVAAKWVGSNGAEGAGFAGDIEEGAPCKGEQAWGVPRLSKGAVCGLLDMAGGSAMGWSWRGVEKGIAGRRRGVRCVLFGTLLLLLTRISGLFIVLRGGVSKGRPCSSKCTPVVRSYAG